MAADQDDQEPAASAVPLTYFSNDAKGKLYGKMPESSVSLALADCRFRRIIHGCGAGWGTCPTLNCEGATDFRPIQKVTAPDFVLAQ
jgi:hypothetical protein